MNINIKEFNFIVDDDNRWFWKDTLFYEPLVFKYLNDNKNKDVFYDFGSYIGIFSLYASKKYKTVLSLEPDHIAYKYQLDNITNNNITNIHLLNKAIYKESTKINFGTFDYADRRGCCTSSINGKAINDESSIVETITFEKCLEYGYPDLIKIDIEGGEEYLIDDLIKYKFPKIILAIHISFIKNIKEFLKKLYHLMEFYDAYDINYNKIPVDFLKGELYIELKNN